MVFQSPDGFEATTKSYFYQRAREADRKLARRVFEGERFTPGRTVIMVFHASRGNALRNGITSGTPADSSRIISLARL
jgi:hypothetical protein